MRFTGRQRCSFWLTCNITVTEISVTSANKYSNSVFKPDFKTNKDNRYFLCSPTKSGKCFCFQECLFCFSVLQKRLLKHLQRHRKLDKNGKYEIFPRGTGKKGTKSKSLHKQGFYRAIHNRIKFPSSLTSLSTLCPPLR